MENTLANTKKTRGIRVLFAGSAALAAAFFALHLYIESVCREAYYGDPRIISGIIAGAGFILSAAVAFAGVRLLKTKRLIKLAPFIAAFGLLMSVLPGLLHPYGWMFYHRYLYIDAFMIYVPCFVMLTAFLAGTAGTYRSGRKWQSLPVTLMLLVLPSIALSYTRSLAALVVLFFTWFFFMIALARGGRLQTPWYVLLGVSVLFIAVFTWAVIERADALTRLSTVFTRGQSDPLGAGYVRSLADQVMRNARVFGAADERSMNTAYGALPLSLYAAHFEFPFELLYVLAKCGWVAFIAVIALLFVIPAALLVASRRAPNAYAKYFTVFTGLYLLGKTGLGLFSLLFSDISAPLPFFDFNAGAWMDIFLIFAAFTLLLSGETDVAEAERVYDASVPVLARLRTLGRPSAEEISEKDVNPAEPPRRIEDADKNFKVSSSVDLPDGHWIGAQEAPFEICGVFYENGRFRRIPESVAKSVNEGVLILHANTAGGRVRFCTDSPYVAIHAEMDNIGKMPHFAVTGSAGFDLYADNEYAGTFVPPFDMKHGYESRLFLPGDGKKEITIHFPLYSDVKALKIGLKYGAALLPPAPYLPGPPAVYYGSSITQGGCASRPGLAYQNILSRRFNVDHLNLGFSGSAKGEDAMADYIAGLDMRVFIYDYDHNAPTPEHLRATHRKLFEAVRAKHPTLPIILMSRPVYTLRGDEPERLAIIRETYEAAKAAGDENIYLIDGPALMALAKNEGTVDGCHPNDLGFYSMADAVEKILRKII